MKTREEAEARALELYPKTHIETVNQLHEVSRDAYLQGWDDSQLAMDAKQADVKVEGVSDGTEGVIEGVTEGVSGKQTCGFCVEPASKTIKEAFDNIPKEVRDRHAKAAYEEHKQLREAAAKVTAFWRVNPSIVKDWEKDMHEFIEKLEKELK